MLAHSVKAWLGVRRLRGCGHGRVGGRGRGEARARRGRPLKSAVRERMSRPTQRCATLRYPTHARPLLHHASTRLPCPARPCPQPLARPSSPILAHASGARPPFRLSFSEARGVAFVPAAGRTTLFARIHVRALTTYHMCNTCRIEYLQYAYQASRPLGTPPVTLRTQPAWPHRGECGEPWLGPIGHSAPAQCRHPPSAQCTCIMTANRVPSPREAFHVRPCIL